MDGRLCWEIGDDADCIVQLLVSHLRVVDGAAVYIAMNQTGSEILQLGQVRMVPRRVGGIGKIEPADDWFVVIDQSREPSWTRR